jgi:hypothetical protein
MGFDENAGDTEFKDTTLHLTFPMLEVAERAISAYRAVLQRHHMELLELAERYDKSKQSNAKQMAIKVRKEADRMFSYWDDAMTLSALFSNEMSKWGGKK